MNWTSGYVRDVDYTHGYYRELCPEMLQLAALHAGFAPPTAENPRYLELGFGQGISVNIHAAAHTGEYWGTDFNPSHAAHARALAEASMSGAVLLDESFAELAARTDLPEFDIIALHGIWSWISDENRQVIVDIVRRKLRVGGMLYLSYNCLPGLAPAMPLRHLMTLQAEIAGSDASGMGSKIDAAVAFTQQVVDSGALYFKANPAVAERLKRIATQNRNYLAHEYFNKDWEVMAFSDVARCLENGKVTFATTAHLVDHIEAVNLTAEGQKLLLGIQQPILRQSVRDYLINQQFRRDIFIKGPRRLTPMRHTELLRAQHFVLITPPSDVPMKVMGALGESTLQEAVYRPVIEVMAEDNFKPKSFEQLMTHSKLKSLPVNQAAQAIIVLTGAGHMHPTKVSTKETRARCDALNQYLCENARSTQDIACLASPVTGGGVPVSRFQQLFLVAQKADKKSPEEQARFVWDILVPQGQRLMKDGKPIDSPEDNLATLTKQATEFAEKHMPILKALEVI